MITIETPAGLDKMLFNFLAPSSALQLTTFADVDEFRPAETMEDARSIPLDAAHFAAARAVVRLPACRIILTRSFARILDTMYRAPGGMVILSMTDDLRVKAKGVDLDSRFILAMRGTDDCNFVELRANLHAMIIFSPALPDRGWFDLADKVQAFAADGPALTHARMLVLSILRTAAAEPGLFEQPDIANNLQEGLLLAVDDLFRTGHSSDRRAALPRRRSSRLVGLIDDYVASYPTSPASSECRYGRLAARSRRCAA